MRHYNPQDEWFQSQQEEAAQLNAPTWMLEALQMNPDYLSWGIYEDYMAVNGSGWNSPVERETWRELNWELNDMNEVVNFYFEIEEENNEPVLGLMLWIIHPRKGASRGVRVSLIQQSELPEVVEYLKQARSRNYQRFSKLG